MSTAAMRAMAAAAASVPTEVPSPPSSSPAATSAIAALARLNQPGQRELDDEPRPVGGPEGVALEPHVGIGPVQVAAVTGPGLRLSECDAPPATGTAHRVLAPGEPGTDPARPRSGGSGPDHHRVVGVGHHDGPAPPQRRRAARARRQRSATNLTSATRSNWSRERLRSTTTRGRASSSTRPEVTLVDLEHGGRCRRIGDQGSHVPGRHVGAGVVGGDRRPSARNGRRQHPRRRGLAVGPRHQQRPFGPGSGRRGGSGREPVPGDLRRQCRSPCRGPASNH